MQFPGASFLLAAAAAAVLAACGDDQPSPPSAVPSNPTAILGGYGSGPKPAAEAALSDASGRPIPAPRLPRNTSAQLVRTGPDAALGVWVQDGHAVSATWQAATGWSAPLPLEDIYGEASDAQLASNGQGVAIAVWRHTVGDIRSLRFSRFDAATGWSTPDVMPGALPRPASADAGRPGPDAPRLQMDAQGNAFAQWPSGFDANEVQTARYVAGHGWTRALSEPLAARAAPEAGAAGVPQ